MTDDCTLSDSLSIRHRELTDQLAPAYVGLSESDKVELHSKLSKGLFPLPLRVTLHGVAWRAIVTSAMKRVETLYLKRFRALQRASYNALYSAMKRLLSLTIARH